MKTRTELCLRMKDTPEMLLLLTLVYFSIPVLVYVANKNFAFDKCRKSKLICRFVAKLLVVFSFFNKAISD